MLHHNYYSRLLPLLFAVCLFSVASCVVATEQGDNRLVLALFDKENGDIFQSNTHLLLEMPLNRLGMVVEYHDIADSNYPDPGKYRAVVVWLSSYISDYGKNYYAYLQRAIAKGVRVVLINGVGVTQDKQGRAYTEEVSALLGAMGFKVGGIQSLENPFAVVCHELKPDVFNFEIAEATDSPIYRDYELVDQDIEVWENIERTDVKDSSAVAVATGKFGGFIADVGLAGSFVEEPDWGILWDLNPFAFLVAALGLEENLRPDVTTSFGLRSAFAHIDGDGSSNYSIDVTNPPQPCTKILKENILDRYKFPHALSAIAYRLTEEGSEGKIFVDLLREMLNLPQVEAASHTYAHPMIWKKGVLGFKVPGYTFDPEMETVGSMEMIQQILLPPEKKVQLLLWSGDCQATEEALAPLAEAGLANLNGGNARYDDLYRGIYNICPLSIQVGPYRQYYAPAGNEYLYTKDWTQNFGGFAKVVDTFKTSAKPRYLPVNVYYHYYLAERQAGLNSLFKIYDWCETQDLCWLYPIEYVRQVEGYMAARTGTAGEGKYFISNYGELQTVRLDNEKRKVDIAASSNVLGYSHFADSLYVSLLPGDKAEIVLIGGADTGMSLRYSTAVIRQAELGKKSLRGELRCFNKGFIEFAGVSGVQFTLDGKEVESLPDSPLRFPLPAGQGSWLKFAAEADNLQRKE